MPYSIFKRLGRNDLRPTNIFLQLANRSIKYPLGILKDVPIKVGEFYMPIDFVIIDMAKDFQTQIILGRLFLTTAGCKIDVKEGRLTFDVGENHTEFGLFKDCESSLSTFSYCGCDVLDLDEPAHLTDITQNYPYSFDCALFVGYELDGVTVDPLSTSIVEDER